MQAGAQRSPTRTLDPHTHPALSRSCPLYAPRRRALAVYPVLLMYVSIGWLALVKS
jgi:hypothetical protein